MAIQNTVLVGNGIYRCSKDNPALGDNYRISWKSTLENLAIRAHYPIRDVDEKPLTLVFDELVLNAKNFSKYQLQLMAMASTILPGEPDLNHAISCLSKNILTTNYYSAFMMYGCGFDTLSFKSVFPHLNENTFSIFRGKKTKSRSIWHIHGEMPIGTSITLGLRQYARYQNQISNYLFGKISYAKVKNLCSPLYLSIPNFEFEKSGQPYSWVDLFLRDHIHMVGFGMAHTESILWWLLTEKIALQEKYPKWIGGLTYHQVVVDRLSREEEVKLHMLEDLGATVNQVQAKDYKSGYLKIADTIKPGLLRLLKAKDFEAMSKL